MSLSNPRAQSRLQIVLESLAGPNNANDIATRHGVREEDVELWTTQFLSRGSTVFELDSTFRVLLENTLDAVIVATTTGKIQFASPSVTSTFGHDSDQLAGRPLAEILHQDDSESLHAALLQVSKHTEPADCEIRFATSAGQWRRCQVTVSNFLKSPFVGGLVLTIRDISDQRRSEDTLHRLEERYYRAFNATRDSIAISRLSDGKLLDVNDGFLDMVGRPREQVIGSTARELGLYQDDGQRNRIVDLIQSEGRVRDLDIEFESPQGRYYRGLITADLVEIRGEPCIYAVVRDTTERYRNFESLKKTTSQLREEQNGFREKNVALNQVLEHLEHQKIEFRASLNERLRSLVAPVVDAMEAAGDSLKKEKQLLESRVEHILSEHVNQYSDNASKLTSRQLDICELIRDGFSSQQIADRLSVSLQTVHKHRQMIRRKLQLSNQPVNLTTYLRSKPRNAS